MKNRVSALTILLFVLFSAVASASGPAKDRCLEALESCASSISIQDFEKAMAFAIEAGNIAADNDLDSLQAEALCLMAGIDIKTSRDEQGWAHAVQAERIARKGGFNHPLVSSLISKSRVCSYAETSKDFNRNDEALVYLEEAYAVSESSDYKDLLAEVCYMFSEIYVNKNRWNKTLDKKLYSKAEDYLKRGDEYAAGSSDSDLSTKSIYGHLRLLRSNGNYSESIKYCLKALEDINQNNYISISNLYDQLTLLYSETDQKDLAVDSHQKCVYYINLYSQQKAGELLQEMEAKYENDRLKAENSAARRRAKYITIVAFLIVVLLTFALLALSYAFRAKAKAQQMERKLDKVRTNFFTNITHEFRTPLTVILGLSRKIKDGSLKEEDYIHSGEAITRQGENLLTLINQLLDISKIRSAIGEPDWKTGDVVPLMRMLAESYGSLAQQKGIDLTYTPQHPSLVMDYVPDYFEKIMRNLISNAIKFTGSGGIVSLTSDVSDGYFELKVSDTGKGISEEAMEHIFEEFYQESNNSMEMGTGVGLSLVYQIVKSLGGKISVDSTLGKGTTFTVLLPTSAPGRVFSVAKTTAAGNSTNLVNAETSGSPVSETTTGISTNQVTSLTRILIVEDNPDISFYIGTVLDQTKKYSLSYASNGEEGLKMALEEMPYLIISDLMMPVMDGNEMMRRVRSNPIISHIPIIVITAKGTERDKIEGLEAGADAYLYKPFNEQELLVRVAKLLEQRRLLREKYSKAVFSGDVKPELAVNNSDKEFMDKVVGILEKQIENGQTDIAAIASELCMSLYQLRSKVQSVTGLTPQAYATQLRLSRAKNLLVSDYGLPLGNVASQCGFLDQQYFSRLFKKTYGITPSECRKAK